MVPAVVFLLALLCGPHLPRNIRSAPRASAVVALQKLPRNSRAETAITNTKYAAQTIFDAVTRPFIALVEARAQRYRRRKRPKRIILVRHGESGGNVDRMTYCSTPDSRIPLTERGFAQARSAGQQIRKLVGNESTRFFFSPYIRTRQTLLAILEAFEGIPVQTTSEPRLREQDFGNYQNPESMEKAFVERQKFGRFYYRFPDGESGTDVFDRVCDLWSSLYRVMDSPGRESRDLRTGAPVSETLAKNYVLVTHGLLMRIFCMCYFKWTVREFEQVWNPTNCEIWVLERNRPSDRFRLLGRWRASPFSGKLIPIAFGANKRQPVHDHMVRVTEARVVVAGGDNALDDESLIHLRVPGPINANTPRERQLLDSQQKILNKAEGTES